MREDQKLLLNKIQNLEEKLKFSDNKLQEIISLNEQLRRILRFRTETLPLWKIFFNFLLVNESKTIDSEVFSFRIEDRKSETFISFVLRNQPINSFNSKQGNYGMISLWENFVLDPLNHYVNRIEGGFQKIVSSTQDPIQDLDDIEEEISETLQELDPNDE